MIVDFWSNLRSPAAVKAWENNPTLAGVANFFGNATFEVRDVAAVVEELDENRVDMALVSGLAGGTGHMKSNNYTIEEALAQCEEFPERVRAAMWLEGLQSIQEMCRTIERVSEHPLFSVVRVIPMVLEDYINSPRLYPVYERCEALGIPVSINVGIPGPRVRAKFQDATLIDDVLIDFPDLVVIGAHMGHPYEKYLIRLMLKYENLYLTNSAYLAKYFEPEVIRFMDSSRGRDRLMFASDAPLLSLERSLKEAKLVDVGAEAMDNFLGGNAARVLDLA